MENGSDCQDAPKPSFHAHWPLINADFKYQPYPYGNLKKDDDRVSSFEMLFSTLLAASLGLVQSVVGSEGSGVAPRDLAHVERTIESRSWVEDIWQDFQDSASCAGCQVSIITSMVIESGLTRRRLSWSRLKALRS